MEQQNVLGCVGIVGLIVLIVMIITGGMWRTEVTYVPPDLSVTGDQTPFEENLTAHHWVLGLVKGRQPDLQKALAKYVRPGEQITKLTVITRHTWVNNLVSTVTLFIYSPVTITIKGSIVRK